VNKQADALNAKVTSSASSTLAPPRFITLTPEQRATPGVTAVQPVWKKFEGRDRS
jgi:hypothetical protein